VQKWLNAERLIDSGGHHHHHHAHDDVNRHGEAIRAFCLVRDEPISPAGCDMFLEMLRIAHGPKLLRVKGVIALSDDPERPLVIHGVQHIFHPPVRLAAWPDADRRTRIVFILKDLDAKFVDGLFAAFAGEIRPDAPDAQALTENPLAPRSGGLLA
jgi:G3E family GTPase